MIKTSLDKHFPCIFLCLCAGVVALEIAVPRAASFGAPLAGLIAMIVYAIGKGRFLMPRRAELFFMLAITALAGLSALWAIDPGFALERAAGIGGILLIGLFFIEAARRITAGDIPAGYVKILGGLYAFACAIVALEIFCGLPLYRLINSVPADQPVYSVFMNRSVVVMAGLYFPLLLLVIGGLPHNRRTRYALGALMTLALIAALALTQSQSAQLLFALGVVFALFFPVNLRGAWIALGAIIIALGFAAPWLAQSMYQAFPYEPDVIGNSFMTAASIPHRLEVWNFVATEALKHPLYGQGIEAIRFIKSDTWLKLPNANSMLHPHNAPLQIWVEFGVIGMALASALFAYILRSLWLSPPLARRFGLAVVIGMLAVMSTGYGLWQSWQVGLLITLAGMMALAAGTGRALTR